MRRNRRSTSSWLISQALCFCLLLQGSGIAQALPLPPKPTFVSKDELQSARFVAAAAPAESGLWKRFAIGAWATARATGDQIQGQIQDWLEDARAPGEPLASDDPPLRVAQAGGVLPLPSRLMPAFFATTTQGPGGPPTPPGFAGGTTEATPPPRAVELLEKAGTNEIPLVAGWNLISLPLDPPDPDPAAVFAPIAGQLARVEAHDVCDVADPWKLYDPADAAASDLTAVTPAMGLWVKVTAATVLPLAGTLPATTDIDLCQGWNHIGFPADQPRAPTAVFSSIAGKWQRLFGHDAFDIKDPFEFFDPAVPAWANDLELMRPGYGYWLLASEATTLTISNQGPPPTVAFTAPLDLGVVTEPTEITGTVDSDRLESWTLSAEPKDDGPPVVLATGTAPVADAPLGTFDPTLLLNGLYELELTATDFQGQQVSDSIAVTVEGQMKIGHFTLSFVDLAIPVSGLDIEIVRTYQSRDKEPRDFGVGWSLDIRQGSYRNNRAPGDGWQIVASQPPVPFPCAGAVETKSHLTIIRLSDQEVYRFRPLVVDPIPGVGRCDGRVTFEYVSGPLPGSTLEILGNDLVYYENAAGNDQLIDYDTLATFEPRDVRLTTRDGRIFELDLNEGVTRVEDLNGNQLTFTPAGIAHSSGKSIAFERDAEGRIIKITDPMNREMFYSYDPAGDLDSFVDRAGATSRFTYDDHRLLDIEDPRGVKPIRNEYDAEGRLVRHIDALGKVIELDHDLQNRREVVTDRLGASRVLEYDARGNVVRESDELSKVTTRVFDAHDNLLSETDPAGRKTSYTYTASNDLETRTDPLGNIIRYTYNARGQVLTTTDPRGGVTTHSYNAVGNLTSITDPVGNTSSFTPDTAGNVVSATDAGGNVVGYEYGIDGQLTREVDPLGSEILHTYDLNGSLLTTTRFRTLSTGVETLVTTFAYDELGRLLTTTYPDGSTASTTYDLLGNVTSVADELGRTTTYTYDGSGRRIATIYPDGTMESRTYDDGGRVLTRTDRAGRSITTTYDALAKLSRKTFPDGAVHSFRYDDSGYLIEFVNAGGNVTLYEVDAHGRRTARVDPLGNRVEYTYDANGNRTQIKDPEGHVTRFEYDAASRLVRTFFADGTESRSTYDVLGRQTSFVDQGGNTTTFAFDALGRLIEVSDATGQATTFAYDELGNQISQTDANGNVTRLEHDRRGRLVRRTLPDGLDEVFTYDAVGNLASRISFGGQTMAFTYDSNGDLIEKRFPDGSSTSLTYTPSGRRASVTDRLGTTRYQYDDRDRLIRLTYPGGQALQYQYDMNGNRTALTAMAAGQTLTATSTYDAADRLASVTDPQGNNYTYSYSASGNRTSLAYPNGVVTSCTYDVMNRLKSLTTATSLSEVLQSYTYTVAGAGNRTRIDETGGIVRQYAYDPLQRLTAETVSDDSGFLYEYRFIYDAVGNRLQQSRTDGSGTTLTNDYEYDARDRLLSQGEATFTWDADGRRIAKGGSDPVTYVWDPEDRLLAVILADTTRIDYDYDIDGHRVRTRITPPTGPPVVTNHLVDPSSELSHVVLETDAAGDVSAYYTRGDGELLSVLRGSEVRYYHADGLGSIRRLTDSTGAETDRYDYTAFGELLEQVGHDPNPYLFAGEARDFNSTFYYLRARWMDPGVGRLVSADPFPGLTADPRTLHRYLYALDDPINRVDPSGKFSLGEAMVSFAVAITVFTISHPFLAGAIGITFNLLMPVEFAEALQAAAGPYGAPFGTVARGRARFFQLVKSQRFRNFVKRNKRAAGKLWHETGGGFEKLLRNLLPGAGERPVVIDVAGRSVDIVYNSIVIEAKTGTKLGKRELLQLESIADFAARSDRSFVYQFLNKPGPSVIEKIEDAGGTILWIFE